MADLFPYLRYEVKGTEALTNYLASLDAKIQRQYSRVALKAGAAPIAEAIRSSDAYTNQTGLLRSSERVAAGVGDRKGITSVLIQFNTTVGAFLTSGTSSAEQKAKLDKRLIYKYLGNTSAKYRVFYARFVEFGHKPSGWYAGMAGATEVPAHSFARSGFDATVDAAADIIEESLAAQIEAEE